jgi:hypothetical protein
MFLRILAVLAGLFLYLVIGRYLFRAYIWLGCFADHVPYASRRPELDRLSAWQVLTWPLLLVFLPFYAVWALVKRIS